MKKALIFIFSLGIIFSGCKKDDDYAFEKSPDERIAEALATYQAKLAGAENGWKATVVVDGGRGATYSLYFKFNNSNRVTMASDFDSASAVTPKESSYRLKAQQQLTLIFDTYSYLHILADPNESVAYLRANINGGSVGEGLISDFEFIFDDSQIKADTIRMNGKVNGSKLVMTRASKAEGDAYLGGQFKPIGATINNRILTYFKRLTVGTQSYDVVINSTTRDLKFIWLDGSGNPRTFTTKYYDTLGGIVLNSPVVNGAQTISGFSGASWNAATSTLSFTSNSGLASSIRPIVVPLYVDKTAANRWWQYSFDQGTYWISLKGFHVNGVDDGYNISSLPRYYYLIYWADYGSGADLFAPIFLNTAGDGLTLSYGAAPAKPAVTVDGRAIFTSLGNYGTYPTTGPARLSRNQVFIPEGHYFVQTGTTAYDMVSAKDGLVWVTWRF